MRELERFVILQVVDTRWREHLESMDYLREGVHLRSMAQKDPLVEYTAEGHKMFEELSQTIREEVVFTLFHAELAPEEAAELSMNGQDGGNGALSYEHQSLAGADAIAAADERRGGRRGRARRSRSSARSRSATRSAATTRAGAAPARSTRSATALDTGETAGFPREPPSLSWSRRRSPELRRGKATAPRRSVEREMA